MSCTFLESSFIDCMVELLESCVSEMMKGSDPASKILWILPESVGTAHKQQFEAFWNATLGYIFSPLFLAEIINNTLLQARSMGGKTGHK